MNIIEKKLFLVRTTLLVAPMFYVEGTDILDATRKAKEIVDFYNNDKVVGTISTVDLPMLDIEKDKQ